MASVGAGGLALLQVMIIMDFIKRRKNIHENTGEGSSNPCGRMGLVEFGRKNNRDPKWNHSLFYIQLVFKGHIHSINPIFSKILSF